MDKIQFSIRLNLILSILKQALLVKMLLILLKYKINKLGYQQDQLQQCLTIDLDSTYLSYYIIETW